MGFPPTCEMQASHTPAPSRPRRDPEGTAWGEPLHHSLSGATLTGPEGPCSEAHFPRTPGPGADAPGGVQLATCKPRDALPSVSLRTQSALFALLCPPEVTQVSVFILQRGFASV